MATPSWKYMEVPRVLNVHAGRPISELLPFLAVLTFMRSPTWVTAAEIDDWAESTVARGLLPELMRRLVLATVDQANLQVINFPAREEVQRHGYDRTTSTGKRPTGHRPKQERHSLGRPFRQAAAESGALRIPALCKSWRKPGIHTIN
jgi:hypothetical protein